MPPSRMSRVSASPESGVTLMEAVVALAILGVIAATFLSGVVATYRAARLADQQATAGSLAQSQMEWAQNAAYATQYTAPLPSGKDYINYSAAIAVAPVPGTNASIQKITVTVTRSGEPIMKLEGYKVDREPVP